MAPFGVVSDWALGLAETVVNGARFPPLILVTSGPGSDGQLVVLEGHASLTAYLLCLDQLPPEPEVLVGASPAITCWGLWEPTRRGARRCDRGTAISGLGVQRVRPQVAQGARPA